MSEEGLGPELDPPSRAPRILIALLALLLVGSIALYFSGASLKSVFYGMVNSQGEKVGMVKAVTGQLKRQPKDSLEFLDAKVNSDLFNEDTVMTGPEDRATIEIFDGTVLELDPGSLVRLTFDATQGPSGIQRRVLVDVVAGNVNGDLSRPQVVLRKQGKPVVRPQSTPQPMPLATATPTLIPTPTPTPTPTETETPSPTPTETPSPEPLSADQVEITQPKPGQIFKIPAGQSPPLKQALIFQAPAGRPDTEIVMALRNGAGKEVLRRAEKPDASGRGGLLATFESPGRYELVLLNSDGSPIGEKGISAKFRVAPEFTAIETLPPLVGGESVTSNRFSGKRMKDFDVVLRWKPLDGVTKYEVTVNEKTTGKLVTHASATGGSYAFPKGKIYVEPLTYVIRANLLSGYAAVSAPQTFLFNFYSPPLTLPADGQSVSLVDPAVGKKGGILFTWQRTTFTQGYEFELATDAAMNQIFKKVPAKENFIVVRGLKPGDYWWRVHAISGDMKSPNGQAFHVVVTP